MNLQIPRSDDGVYEVGEIPNTPAPSSTTTEAAPPLVLPRSESNPGSGSEAKPQTPASPALQAEPPNADPKAEEAPATAPPPKPKKKRRKGRRWDVPSWGVSLMVHLALLVLMATAGIKAAPELIGSIDAAMIDTELSDKEAGELMQMDAIEPNDSSEAIDTSSMMVYETSATPTINSRTAAPSEASALSGLVSTVAPPSTTSSLPAQALINADLGSGGKMGGIPGEHVETIEEALDRLAKEIIAHLQKSKVTVVWLFDESGSMKDDQQAIRDKFERVATQLNIHVDEDRKNAGDLNHAIVSFGKNIHFDYAKPTDDLKFIQQAIDRIPIDESGVENTMGAIINTVAYFDRPSMKDRKILLVLATDESGDDGDLVEQARQTVLKRRMPVYILGRQAMFGYPKLRLEYVDPVTKDKYWPSIDRGPEAPGLENLQYDGLHRDRRDEQPSGFAPYELARISRESNGIYFVLPTSENQRVRQREKAYSMDALKEYLPDGRDRDTYRGFVKNTPLRRTITEVAELTKSDFGFRNHYPIELAALAEAISKEVPKVDIQLNALLEIEKRLRALEGARDRDPSQRWKAHYDLMLAQIITYQIKAYEYRACLKEMVALAQQGKLVPKNKPSPKRIVEWTLGHSKKKKAPESETEKKYTEAERLLKQVIERHPNSPWADLAQTELNRGFGCDWGEWTADPRYRQRANLVPKF